MRMSSREIKPSCHSSWFLNMTPRSRAKCVHQAPPLAAPRPPPRQPKPLRILRKCYSEPVLFPASGGSCRSSNSSKGRYFFRLNTIDNSLISSPSDLIASPLSRTNVGYEKDAKVLITVTVEGSPGPIRTLVQLGTSVEDTIKLVIQKYMEQGRTPWLPNDASSAFDLHVSYFSLQCLDRSNAIGETGSRSFYLRKKNVRYLEKAATTTLVTPEIMSDHESSTSLKQPSPPPMMVLLLPPFMSRKINKFTRRMHKLFKMFGCLDST
ncbi:hypothetical protein Cgig2_002485 [Carnegiea gigantea]|uniref:DUF7054 domain-containing protein n=1 Tax=Carnegiea gigantea TaxID=171969 RepID=A0A9Q1QNK3_9CARY|nr:hypothetical protein Cgig2_002485 [Carnegiea gigantea]